LLSRLAASSLDTLMYFKKEVSVLWPVIFISSIEGNPSKYRLVAKLRSTVCDAMHSHNSFSGSLTPSFVQSCGLTCLLDIIIKLLIGKRPGQLIGTIKVEVYTTHELCLLPKDKEWRP
jgi:hypothetical protein